MFQKLLETTANLSVAVSLGPSSFELEHRTLWIDTLYRHVR